MAADKSLGQTITQPAIGRSQQIDVLWQQTHLFLQFAVHRLLWRFIGLDSALRKLPGILAHPTPPEEAVLVIAEDDPHIRPKAVGIYHIWNQVLIFNWIDFSTADSLAASSGKA